MQPERVSVGGAAALWGLFGEIVPAKKAVSLGFSPPGPAVLFCFPGKLCRHGFAGNGFTVHGGCDVYLD